MWTYFIRKPDGTRFGRILASEAQREALIEEAAREGWTIVGGEVPPPDPLMERLVFGNA